MLFCRTLPRHETLDVRLSDVSTTGIGFTSAKELHAGDMLVVAATLAGKIVDIETRVVRVDPAPYGRECGSAARSPSSPRRTAG